MTEPSTLDQARFIFTTVKLIRDRIFRAQTAHLASHGQQCAFGELSVTQLHAIMIVRQRGEISMSELADLMSVSPPSASSMVDRLVEKGVLDRRHSRSDRRKVMVRVTPAVSKDIETVEESVLQSMVELVKKLGPDTTRTWCEVLDRIKIVLENDIRAK